MMPCVFWKSAARRRVRDENLRASTAVVPLLQQRASDLHGRRYCKCNERGDVASLATAIAPRTASPCVCSPSSRGRHSSHLCSTAPQEPRRPRPIAPASAYRHAPRPLTVSPERANLVLASDVPHGERDVLVLDRLDVESCAGRLVSICPYTPAGCVLRLRCVQASVCLRAAAGSVAAKAPRPSTRQRHLLRRASCSTRTAQSEHHLQMTRLRSPIRWCAAAAQWRASVRRAGRRGGEEAESHT